MRYEEFIKMNMEKRAEVVWAQGRFLTEKRYPDQHVELYAMNNFFVEIWFSIPHNIRDFNFLMFIRSFKKISAIESYLIDDECFQLIKAC